MAIDLRYFSLVISLQDIIFLGGWGGTCSINNGGEGDPTYFFWLENLHPSYFFESINPPHIFFLILKSV